MCTIVNSSICVQYIYIAVFTIKILLCISNSVFIVNGSVEKTIAFLNICLCVLKRRIYD